MTDIHLNSLDFKGRWKRSISSILVAVDGSSPSFRAADYALEKLASRYGAKLFLITLSYMPAKYHVTQPDVIESNEGQKEMDDAWRRTRTQKAKQEEVLIWTEFVNSHRQVDFVLLEYAE